MKKIFKSALLVLGVAAIAGYATYSFFNDTETSNGNTFTAGAIDLSLGGTFASAANGSSSFALDPNNNGKTLYNFTDLKPGDEGHGSFNLKVTSNDAYVCAKTTITGTPEHEATEPEVSAGDSASDTTGELQNYLQMATFADLNRNGAYDTNEPVNVNQYFSGDGNGFTAAEVAAAGWVSVADTTSPNTWLAEGTLPKEQQRNAGMLYCFGDFTTTGSTPETKVVTGCNGNGSVSQNMAQTDGVVGNIEFYAVQTRNNPNFTCASMNSSAVVVGANNLATSETSPTGWFLYNDQGDAIQTNGAGHQFVVGPSTPLIGTGSVEFTKTATDKYGIATNQFAGTQLSAIGTLQYSTYRTSGTSAQAPSLGFDIDSDTTDAFTNYQGRLTYEPYFTQTVNTGQWQTWNTEDNSGTGNWWFSHATLSNAAASVCTQANPCTWAEMKTAYPHIGITGRVILRTNGADNEIADMNADKLVIGIGVNTQTFDFGN